MDYTSLDSTKKRSNTPGLIIGIVVLVAIIGLAVGLVVVVVTRNKKSDCCYEDLVNPAKCTVFSSSKNQEYLTFNHKYYISGNWRLHYVDAGNGSKTILLIHGWPQSWFIWRKVIPSLVEAGYRVIVPDMRGCGDSFLSVTNSVQYVHMRYTHRQSLQSPKGNYTQEVYTAVAAASDFEALLTSLQLQSNLLVVGHDMGALHALAYALKYPTIKGLMFMEAPIPNEQVYLSMPVNPRSGWSWWFSAFMRLPEFPEQLVKGRERTYFGYFFKAFAMNFTATFTTADLEEYYRVLTSPSALTANFGFMRSLWQDVDDLQPLYTASKISVPTVAVGAQFSMGEGVAIGVQLAASNVTSVIVPNSGHWIAEEQSGFVSAQIKDFAARVLL